MACTLLFNRTVFTKTIKKQFSPFFKNRLSNEGLIVFSKTEIEEDLLITSNGYNQNNRTICSESFTCDDFLNFTI